MTPPQRAEVLQVIDRLLSGDMGREVVAAWASARHVEIASDPLVEETLDILALIDARHVREDGQPSDYMYDLAEVLVVRAQLTGDRDG